MAEVSAALIYCEAGMLTPLGKTTHGLIRHSSRYQIVGVIDSTTAGHDAGFLLNGENRGIPVFANISSALRSANPAPEVMVIGIAPTGFGAEGDIIAAAEEALSGGLSVHNGLHLYLSDLPRLLSIAQQKALQILDIRKPPLRRLKMLSGDILSVKVPRLLVTGQDAAVGKRTTAIRLCKGLESCGIRACIIGTGQTAWLQGIEYGVRLDALPLDFAGGEVEHEVVRAYKNENPDLLIIEGQGSLLNPGYSCETMILLTACRPSMLVYVSVPERTHYIDFPDFPIREASEELALLERISGAALMGFVVHHRDPGSPMDVAPRTDLPVVIGADGDIIPLVERIAAALHATSS